MADPAPAPVERPHQATLRFLAEPTDLNFGGTVHGGAVMKWIDQAAYACAVGWCGTYCVTVYVGGIRFYHPIAVGSLVEIDARIIHTGTTSMHIGVDVRACDPRVGAYLRTTHCIIVFVAIDEQRRPTPVPPWQPASERERALEQYAQRHHQLRKVIDDDLKRGPDAP
jgi:acyl-CoA hydrolase